MLKAIRYNNKIPLFKGNRMIATQLDITKPASGMLIWHKADAATASSDENGKNTFKTFGVNYITRLWDFSGNNYHAVTASNTFGNNNGLRYMPTKSENGKIGLISTSSFNGLVINYATSSSLHTTYTVVTPTAAPGSVFMPVLQQGGSWSDRNVEFSINRDVSDATKASISIGPNGSFGTIFTRGGLTASKTYMGKSVCSRLSTSFLDGGTYQVSVSGMPTTGSFADTVTDTSKYGTNINFPDTGFHEFIHYNRLLTDVEREQTEGYLKAKWGMIF